MSPDHKFLDMAQHLGVYFGALFAIFSTAVGFMWRDRKQIKHEIKMARDESRNYAIKNQHEHSELKEKMNMQHAEILKKMIELHSK